ncbi:MAG: flagellar biosynthetic protein FliO [Cyanobacteriota bacterium]|nr:flagellar biosynthetic protein FliO [Cyanobacteriota bacterium]MDY6359381.1 flagellar biosynthetic protein FliO [Cyanobacteriota bacterium]MDY6364918.1 flagellar biosynthetic protein FliO [Cyanobacteriota bacterium]MDY6382859.1 flagellar biosynthetic protein FliO [Cyanobacteriota bacterium]
MGHYIISFTVYTMAMSGLIFFALFIYKKIMNGNMSSNKTKKLSIEETMNINPRKSLMIVKAGDERFLIASDVDKTTLLAKLENDNSKTNREVFKEITTGKQKAEFEDAPLPDLSFIKKDTEENNIDILYPNKLKKFSDNKPKSNTQKNNRNKSVHLEVITRNNPNAASLNRHHLETSKSENVDIEVGEIKNHGLSTIREMVHKVNEM